MDWIIAHIGDLLQIACGVVTVASMITALTDSTSDDRVVNAVQKILNAIALNVGKNKNADSQ